MYTKKSDIIKYKRVYYYCKNHRTSKYSDKIDTKGNKIRVNICDAKIKYEIEDNKYSYFGKHSEECEKTFNTQVINYAEIKEEIDD